MKKTQHINLGGLPFQIDEDAFLKLEKYLDTIQHKFSSMEGSSEVVEDIESRIAEILSKELKQSLRQIVTLQDINKVVDTMGKPEEFDHGEEDTGEGYTTAPLGSKKLYRDGKDKILGGVISGVSKYFGLEDSTWVRLAFIVVPFIDWMIAFSLTGLCVLSYIILWIVLPKAVTSTEQMQMRGQAININSFHEQVKKNSNSEFSERNRVGTVLGEIIKIVAKIIVVLGLATLLFTALSLLLALVAVLFGVGIAIPFVDWFGSGLFKGLIMVGLFMIAIAPIMFLIALITKLLINKEMKFGSYALTSLGLFTIGSILIGVIVYLTSLEYRHKEIVKSEEFIESSGLLIKNLPSVENDKQKRKNVYLEIVPAVDSTYSFHVAKSVRGKSEKVAKNRLQYMNYNYEIKDSVLMLSPMFNYIKKIRKPQVELSLGVPEGQLVTFHPSMSNISVTANFLSNTNIDLSQSTRWKHQNGAFLPVDSIGQVITTTPDVNLIDADQIDLEILGKKYKINIKEDAENDQLIITSNGEKIVDVKYNEITIEGENKKIY